MEKLKCSTLSRTKLEQLIQIHEQGVSQAYEWLKVEEFFLTEEESRQVQYIESRLLNYPTHLMNEATIWARGIYPLLVLAEQNNIQAWSEVPLQATYAQFEIEGIADGILGQCVSGWTPYLVVVEAKRGLEAQNPVDQLYAQLLAAVWINWKKQVTEPQKIFGCYTIADNWTFVRAQVDGIDSPKPHLHIESSREYVEKLEAENILKILKKIILDLN